MADQMRPIERGKFTDVVKPAQLGPAPQLQWIAIEKLVVDESYQRPMLTQTSRQNVRSIAENFDWRFFAPVIVSPIIGGRFAIVDGQHRATAALLCGIEELPCNVVIADQQTQAKAFEAINSHTTKILGLQIHKAKLTSCDPEALRIEAVAKAAGVHIVTYRASSLALKANQTGALAAITKMVRLHGDKATIVALRMIRASAGDLTGFLTGQIIMGVTTVLAEHKAWRDAPALDAVFANIDLTAEWQTAATKRAVNRNVTTGEHFRNALIKLLDRRMTHGG